MIEPLESRIAPAFVFNYLDVDGDYVTVAFSKGESGDALFAGPADPTPAGARGTQLRTIDLQGKSSIFDGANITVTAKSGDLNSDGVLDGDGVANVGYISANGINLASVSVSGDLGKLDEGGFGQSGMGLKSLSVGSLGVQGTSTGAPSLQSFISGPLGTVKIKGNLDGAYLFASGKIGSVSVGGDVIGRIPNKSGSIYATGDLGPVTVKGNVTGGSGQYAGSIGAGGDVSSVTIGGSVIGGSGDNSGTVYSGLIAGAGATMGAIKIGHDLVGGRGGAGKSSGRIVAAGEVASIVIGGSVRGGDGMDSGQISVGDTGSIAITGSLVAESSGAHSASIVVLGTVKTISIGGPVVGGSGGESGSVEVRRIGTLRIGGDLRGGAGSLSGSVTTAEDVGAVTIAGSIIGGFDSNITDGTAQGIDSGYLNIAGKLTKLAIGGSIIGLNATDSGKVVVFGQLGSVTVGHDVQGGTGARSGFLQANGGIGTATIGGSLLGSGSGDSGYVRGNVGIGQIAVSGSVVGGSGDGSNSGFIDAGTGRLGSVSISGDLVGNRAGAPSGTNNGVISARQIGSVTLGGSILAGSGGGTNGTALSGAIVADEDIGAIVIKGSVIGVGSAAKIYAGASATALAEKNIAIKSLTIWGYVDNARILAGVNRDGGGTNGDAQIGAVKVGGQWKTGVLASGVDPVNGNFGDGNDTASRANPHSKIASIVIGGPVLGSPGGTITFGFAAHEIGSFKYNGIAVAQLKGAGNDLFAAGTTNKAKPIGTSTSPITVQKPDGFAIHVFEV